MDKLLKKVRGDFHSTVIGSGHIGFSVVQAGTLKGTTVVLDEDTVAMIRKWMRTEMPGGRKRQQAEAARFIMGQVGTTLTSYEDSARLAMSVLAMTVERPESGKRKALQNALCKMMRKHGAARLVGFTHGPHIAWTVMAPHDDAVAGGAY